MASRACCSGVGGRPVPRLRRTAGGSETSLPDRGTLVDGADQDLHDRRHDQGGSLLDAGKALGGTGDGGIDGIINEDRLGFDAIYVQAKRWKDNTVGRPTVQSFAGSLLGKKGRKGVFITTSTFSKDAQEYVKEVEANAKIVLIDGPTLASLMVDYGIGVSTESTFEIKRLDSDYFSEE